MFFIWGVTQASSLSQVNKNEHVNVYSYEDVLRHFKIVPLSIGPSETIFRWVSFGGFKNPRIVTIVNRSGKNPLIAMKECKLTDNGWGEIIFSGVARPHTIMNQNYVNNLGGAGTFWNKPSDIELAFAEKGTDGESWWFEFLNAEVRKTIFLPQIPSLIRIRPEIQQSDFSEHIDVVDAIKESLICAGVIGWQRSQ